MIRFAGNVSAAVERRLRLACASRCRPPRAHSSRRSAAWERAVDAAWREVPPRWQSHASSCLEQLEHKNAPHGLWKHCASISAANRAAAARLYSEWLNSTAGGAAPPRWATAGGQQVAEVYPPHWLDEEEEESSPKEHG